MGQSTSRATIPSNDQRATGSTQPRNDAPRATTGIRQQLSLSRSSTDTGVQSLRRRRSSSNTQASLPPPRRRRLPSLRFWSRANDNDAEDVPPETMTPHTSTFSSQQSVADIPSRSPSIQSLRASANLGQDSLNNRFIEELDDIASHLSHTLQNLSPPSSGSPHQRASINSDLSSSGPISFEHQTEMLSRLLEVAATSTVTTLMGSSIVNGRRFDNTSRDGSQGDGNDSTFQEFVSSLRRGLLTNELTRNYRDRSTDNMTFFRAFRFDNESDTPEFTSESSTQALNAASSTPTNAPNVPPTIPEESAVIPVMIIGVRSVQQTTETFGNTLEDDVDWFIRGDSNTNQRRRQQQEEAFAQNATPTEERRDDVQEPHPTTQATQRSWVIFVMGNSFAWNHPVLSAPSLMNENPTYEDLLNLQELIGQVKPQVTTKEELDKHDDQLFELKLTPTDTTFLSKSSHEVLCRESCPDRCQICLTGYENNDIVRKLSSCDHFYHRDCIDTWLLKGKNNCPLCRSKGVVSPPSDEGDSVELRQVS